MPRFHMHYSDQVGREISVNGPSLMLVVQLNFAYQRWVLISEDRV